MTHTHDTHRAREHTHTHRHTYTHIHTHTHIIFLYISLAFHPPRVSRYSSALVSREPTRNCGVKSSEWLQIEDANLHTVSHSSLLSYGRSALTPPLGLPCASAY